MLWTVYVVFGITAVNGRCGDAFVCFQYGFKSPQICLFVFKTVLSHWCGQSLDMNTLYCSAIQYCAIVCWLLFETVWRFQHACVELYARFITVKLCWTSFAIQLERSILKGTWKVHVKLKPPVTCVAWPSSTVQVLMYLYSKVFVSFMEMHNDAILWSFCPSCWIYNVWCVMVFCEERIWWARQTESIPVLGWFRKECISIILTHYFLPGVIMGPFTRANISQYCVQHILAL